MATASVVPVVKPVAKKAPVAKAVAKPVVAKKVVRTYGFVIVDKNNYSQRVSDLVNNGATIVAILSDPNVMNSFSVHYFTV